MGVSSPTHWRTPLPREEAMDMEFKPDHLGDRTSLYCPCCGDDGAFSDRSGEFYDGQPLDCECTGHVSVSAEEEPYILTFCEVDHGV